MDQNYGVTDLAKLAMTAMGVSLAGNVSKAAGTAADGQFQKLLEQRAKPAEKPVQSQKPADPDKTPADQTADNTVKSEARDSQAAEETVDTAVEKPAKEDPLEQAKRLAELGAMFMQPQADETWIDVDRQSGEILGVYGPEEYVVAVLDGQRENIPIVGLEPQQLDQLQEIVGQLEQLARAADPEADAMLEATDPTVDHSPAKLLERVVDEQAGKVVGQAAEEILAMNEDEDAQVELVDVEQTPEQVFHDVKAAPVKVGEAYDAHQAQDVNEQIAAQLIPAMEQGQTKVELQLTPEHLGTVKVEITQSENGALHIAITAQSNETRSLLEKHSDSLQTMLASRTQNTVQVEVQRQEESQPKNPYDGHNGQNQQQPQQEQHRPRHSQSSQDFLHQLRLGLVDVEDEA